eukprot:4190437-Amphidinium_carterae.1
MHGDVLTPMLHPGCVDLTDVAISQVLALAMQGTRTECTHTHTHRKVSTPGQNPGRSLDATHET